MHIPKKMAKKATEEVKILRELGRGGFGTVYLMGVKRSTTKYQLAVKVIETNRAEKEKDLKEIETMNQLIHPNIVKLFGGDSHYNKIFLFMEYCPGGNLRKYLLTRKPSDYFTESEVYEFGKQIAFAICYLHQNKIIHRDIKPENIVLMNDNHIKLTDFGISRQLENSLDRAKTQCGTLFYMAPEILQGKDYSYKVDSWSMGLVLQEMMMLLDYTREGDELKDKILSGESNTLPSSGRYGDKIEKLIKGLLEVNVKKRLGMDYVLYNLEEMPETLPDKKSVLAAIKNFNPQEDSDSD